uniref:Putative restriction endonuclease domain-containing protein n=1 Tax=Aureoumbra lagunensis TaxID=44058 RepID=A0A7S3NNC1_9STRA
MVISTLLFVIVSAMAFVLPPSRLPRHVQVCSLAEPTLKLPENLAGSIEFTEDVLKKHNAHLDLKKSSPETLVIHNCIEGEIILINIGPGCIEREIVEELVLMNEDIQVEYWHHERRLVLTCKLGSASAEGEGELFYQLYNWNEEYGLGSVYGGRGGFYFPDGSSESLFIPDASFITKDRKDKAVELLETDYSTLTALPQFVIELISNEKSIRNETEKMENYMRLGVDLGWLIEPKAKTVTIYRKAPETLEGFTVTPPLNNPEALFDETGTILPGFVMNMTKVFQKIDSVRNMRRKKE